MRSTRGAANLARFNAARSAHLIPLLTHELQLCKKRKLEFKSVGLLAAYLSDRLKVHRTTFLRNLKYRVMLMELLSSQRGAVTRVPDTSLDPVILQAKLVSARLEASNLRQELARFKAQLARHEESPAAGYGRDAVDFANLAMLVVNVLTAVEETIVVDFENRTVVDLAARPSERIIAGPERAAALVSWLEQNQAVPAVLRLKRQNRSLQSEDGCGVNNVAAVQRGEPSEYTCDRNG